MFDNNANNKQILNNINNNNINLNININNTNLSSGAARGGGVVFLSQLSGQTSEAKYISHYRVSSGD